MSGNHENGWKYPPPAFEDGKSPLQKKNLSHNCPLGCFAEVKNAIGIDAWETIKQTRIGFIPQLVDAKFVSSAKPIHYMLTRPLFIENCNEFWSLVGGQPIRFSLHEFTDITGLDCGPFPPEIPDPDYRPLWDLLGIPQGAIGGPKYDELAAVFDECRSWTIERRIQVGLLCVLQMGIHGLHHNSRLPMESAIRVFNVEDVNNYPWGRVAFKALLEGIRKAGSDSGSYLVSGCVHVLQFWAYESVTCIAERVGAIKDPKAIPFLRWNGNRTRKTIESLIADEIATHGQVRARNMIMKPKADIYADWGNEDIDPKLDVLINDLLDGKFDRDVYTIKKVKHVHSDKKQKKKKDDFVEPSKKKQRTHRGNETDANKDDVRSKSTHDTESDASDVKKSSTPTIDQLVENLYTRLDKMETNIDGLIRGLESKVIAKVEELFDKRFTSIEDRLGKLEIEMKLMKTWTPIPISVHKPIPEDEANENIDPGLNDDNSKINIDQELASTDFVEKTVKQQVDKKKNLKSPKSKIVKPEPANTKVVIPQKLRTFRKRIVMKAKDECDKGIVIPHLVDTSDDTDQPADKDTGKGVGLNDDSEVADITEKVREEENKVLSDPEDSDEEKLKTQRFKEHLEAAMKSMDKLDNLNKEYKKTSLPPPKYPAIGNSGLTLMRHGLVPAEGIYDPLKPVDPLKWEALLGYLRPYEYIPIAAKPPEIPSQIYFYRVLITPRKDWPESTFGWLGDDHISAFIRLLRIRQLKSPSPFHNERICFLDQWFVGYWVNSYDQFSMNPKNFKFTDGWRNVVLGMYPPDMPSNKKWVYDVDLVYMVHNVGGNHWVTLEVDLKKESILCYDSIMGDATTASDKKLMDKCRPFMRMIPYMLNECIPPEVRKISNKQFTWRRVKRNIPQNENPGDCGVYSLKYIEMLSLGVTFEGLSERNIQVLREKMAAEILDEAPDYLSGFT